jgi:hypothetical protein
MCDQRPETLAHAGQTHDLRHQPPERGHARRRIDWCEATRRKDFEGVAIRERHTPDARRSFGDHELAERAARVVADQRDVQQIERVDHTGDDTRERVRRMIDLWRGRIPMDAERQVDVDAAVAVGEASDDVVPEASGGPDAVDEDDCGPGARHVVHDRSSLDGDGVLGRFTHGTGSSRDSTLHITTVSDILTLFRIITLCQAI